MSLLLTLLILAVLAVSLPNALQYLTQSPRIHSTDTLPEGSYDAALVLGASVLPDGTPSGILQDRLDTAIALYKEGKVPRLIMSGDDESDSSYDEVTNMKRYAVEQGVPSEDVFCDHAGICTYDSMYRARNVFQVRSMVVVTQTYHLYRALWDANSLGMDAVGVQSDLHYYGKQPYYDFREFFARVSDTVKVLRKQTSTYLSEPVSLEQSGDVTSW